MSKQAEIKIELFKFIELTYKHKKGVTAKIMTSGKLFKLSVDDRGRIALMSEVGIVKLEFSPSELDALGIKLKTVSVTFKPGENGKLTYMGSVSFFGAVTFGVSGEFDLRTLVEKCNWGLCKYRFDPGKIDDALAKAGVL